MSRAGRWPGGLRWIIRRTKPSRRQMKNLTAYEKKTRWRYSVICTNISVTGIPGVPGSHHPQFVDVAHRERAVVEDGVRNAKPMGLRNLPSKTWQVKDAFLTCWQRRRLRTRKQQPDTTAETPARHNQQPNPLDP
jgi:hypothetical protein